MTRFLWWLAACGGSAPLGVPSAVEVVPATGVPPGIDAPAYSLANVDCAPDLAVSDEPVRDLALAALACVDAGRHEEARILADVAVTRDELDPLAAFAFARTILVQRRIDGNGCHSDAFLEGALSRLSAVTADAALVRRLVADDLFAEVRPAWRYRLATGAVPSATALVGTRWYGPGIGAWGTTYRLQLLPAGVAVEETLDIGVDGVDPAWRRRTATWSFEQGRLIVSGEEAVQYTVMPDGTLEDGSVSPSALRDHPSECDA